MKAAEGCRCLLGAAHETEVPAHHEDRVEDTEPFVDGAQRQEPNILDPTAATDLGRPWGHVDRHGSEPATLRLQAVPAGAGAHVQHAAADGFEDGPLGIHPLARLGEEPLRPQRGPGVAVVAVEKHLARATVHVVEKEVTESVALVGQDPGVTAHGAGPPALRAAFWVGTP